MADHEVARERGVMHSVSERDAIPGTIAAALERLADADIRQSDALDKVAASMDRLAGEIERVYVRREMHDEQISHLKAEQARLAGNIQWATRTAVASLLSVIVGIILTFKGFP